MDGNDGLPDFLSFAPPPLTLPPHWVDAHGGYYGADVDPCLPRQQAEPSGPAGGADASFVVPPSVGAPPSCSADTNFSGSSSNGSPNFGFGFAPDRFDSAGAASGTW